MSALRSNKSVDTDTLRQGAASHAGEHTSRGALPQRAAHLQRYAARWSLGSPSEAAMNAAPFKLA